MEATLVEYTGSDLSVVNAARVSFHKKSSEFSLKDEGLIKFLAANKHFLPFRHPHLTIHVKAPIFIARQLGKHQVGMSWSEVSRRYVTDDPEFFTPIFWRKKAANVKQGSSFEPINIDGILVPTGVPGDFQTLVDYEELENLCLSMYKEFIEAGVCPEQARMLLPQSMYTEWYWTGSLLSWSHMFNLRTDSHAQAEVRDIANEIGNIISPLFPHSWKALTTVQENE